MSYIGGQHIKVKTVDIRGAIIKFLDCSYGEETENSMVMHGQQQ